MTHLAVQQFAEFKPELILKKSQKSTSGTNKSCIHYKTLTSNLVKKCFDDDTPKHIHLHLDLHTLSGTYIYYYKRATKTDHNQDRAIFRNEFFLLGRNLPQCCPMSILSG